MGVVCVWSTFLKIKVTILVIFFLSELWENPEEFNPDRFLNDQNHYQNNENLIPFSVGKRFCLGKTLAEQEFFLFLTGQLKFFFECSNFSPKCTKKNLETDLSFSKHLS